MVVSGIFLIFPASAFAYIDPGSGSFFLQFLLAALLGALYSIKVFWKDIRAFLKQLFSKFQKKKL